MSENAHAVPIKTSDIKLESNQSAKDVFDPQPNTEELDKDIPVSLYEQRFHKPYAAEFFGMDKNFLLHLDKTGMERLKTIDDFVLSHIDEKELQDTKGSYNKVLNMMMKILGIEENETPKAIIDKLNIVIMLKKLL